MAEQRGRPAAGHARPRGGRGRSVLLVALGALLVISLGALGLHAVLGGGGAADAVPPAPSPLLPGAPVLTTPAPPDPLTVDPLGYDVSYPQCGRVLPTTGGYGIVGITGGRPFTSNSCRGAQLAWASSRPARAVYVNTAYDGHSDPVAYGRAIIRDAVARERATVGKGTPMWWLDVETVNRWLGTQQQNATVLDSAAATLQGLGARVGIYSTPNMWSEITGDWAPGLPTWYATGHGTRARALRACSDSFAGSQPSIVQWIGSTPQGSLDHDVLCPAARSQAGTALAAG